MSKTKWRLIPDERWDTGMLEAWLEDEAAAGWLLADGGTRFAKLERREPKPCRMRLEPAVPESPAEREAKDEAYRELGWERVCQLGDYQVSVSFDPHVPELQSDPVAEGWALEKLLKKQWRGALLGWPVVLAAYAFLVWTLAKTGEPVERLLGANSLAVLLTTALLPLLVWDTVRSVRGIRVLRRQLRAGLPRSHSGGNWRRNHALAVVSFAFFVVIEASILGYPFYQIFAAWGADLDELPQPVPYIAGETLDPRVLGCREGQSHCWRETSFLVPDRYEVYEEWWDDGDRLRLDTDCDLLRFPFLAEALYGERAERLREAWPEETFTELTVPGFDEALLMEAEDCTKLLARGGKAVLWVSAVGVEGLEDHLADYAALLAEFQ